MPVKVGLQYIEIWKESLEEAVRKYEEEPVKKGGIVFYGPSDFTRWSKKWGMKPLESELLGKMQNRVDVGCLVKYYFVYLCDVFVLIFARPYGVVAKVDRALVIQEERAVQFIFYIVIFAIHGEGVDDLGFLSGALHGSVAVSAASEEQNYGKNQNYRCNSLFHL